MLTLRKRRILFWISLLAFIFLTGPVLVYSLGYRLGEGLSFEKTGGIFIKSSRVGAEIYVDGKPKKATSYLSESALIKNIAPGIHEVTLSLPGFWDWKKRLSVKSEQVVSRNVLLVPTDAEGTLLGGKPEVSGPFLKKNVLYVYDNGSEKALYSGIKKFWTFSGDKYIILGEDGNFYINKEKLQNELTDEAKDALKNYSNAIFTDRGKRLVLWDTRNIDSIWLGDEDDLPLWQEELSLNIFTSPRNAAVRQVFAYPDWPDYLLIAMQNGVFALEMDPSGGQNIHPIYKGKKPDIVTVKDERLYVFDDGNYLEIILP